MLEAAKTYDRLARDAEKVTSKRSALDPHNKQQSQWCVAASKMFFYVMNGATDNSNSAAKVGAVDYQMRAKELRMLALRWREPRRQCSAPRPDVIGPRNSTQLETAHPRSGSATKHADSG